MTPRTKTMLVIGGVAAVGVFAVGWFVTSGSSSSSSRSAPQNAVTPNAQDAPGGPFAAQGTMPDYGNLLSYNQIPGVLSAPQATSVDPFSAIYGQFTTTPGVPTGAAGTDTAGTGNA